MRKHCFTVMILLALALNGLAQRSKPFTLKGKFSSEVTGYIYLGYPDGSGKWKTDSCQLKNNTFIFKGDLASISLGRIYYKKNMYEIFLEPTVMTFTSGTDDFSNAKTIGSKTQVENEILNNALQRVQKRWKVVMDTLTAVNKRSNAAFQELRDWVLVPYFEEIKEVNYSFYNKYPASYATAYSMRFTGRDLTDDSLKLFYIRFPPAVKESEYGKHIYELLENRKIGIVNSMAADFSTTDINGNKLSLADFKGKKYVLLDFWGSWCVPCRKESPHLIELYTRYKDRGIEFIGVADDDETQDKWRKAVEEDKLPWLQVLKGGNKEAGISRKFNVGSYPTQILIDKEGKIIGRYTGTLEGLDTMMANIFK